MQKLLTASSIRLFSQKRRNVTFRHLGLARSQSRKYSQRNFFLFRSLYRRVGCTRSPTRLPSSSRASSAFVYRRQTTDRWSVLSRSGWLSIHHRQHFIETVATRGSRVAQFLLTRRDTSFRILFTDSSLLDINRDKERGKKDQRDHKICINFRAF